LGNENEVWNLMIANPTSIALARKYNHVILMDCTYKTNKYNMPVLNVIGMTPFNKSVFICFVFMKQETEENYQRALEKIKGIYEVNKMPKVIATDRELALMNSIQRVFPHTVNLLCICHIQKNVVANCKKFFETNESINVFLDKCNVVTYSYSIERFETSWALMRGEYGVNHQAITYEKNTWLVHKEKFVSTYADMVLHFGSKTSRVEGANSVLKMFLLASVGDLATFHFRSTLAIKNHQQELATLELSERSTVLPFATTELFKHLNEKITHFALKRIFESVKKCKTCEEIEPLSPCTRYLLDAMGLPCSHVLRLLQGPIPPESINPFWQYTPQQQMTVISIMPQDPCAILEVLHKEIEEIQTSVQAGELERLNQRLLCSMAPPKRQVTRGRPQGALNRVIKRASSAFEVAIALPSGVPVNNRRCKRCNIVGSGHNSATCPLRNKNNMHIKFIYHNSNPYFSVIV
jgi:MULE transposase domain